MFSVHTKTQCPPSQILPVNLTEEVKLRFQISHIFHNPPAWTVDGALVAQYQMQMAISLNKLIFWGFYMKPG